MAPTSRRSGAATRRCRCRRVSVTNFPAMSPPSGGRDRLRPRRSDRCACTRRRAAPVTGARPSARRSASTSCARRSWARTQSTSPFQAHRRAQRVSEAGRCDLRGRRVSRTAGLRRPLAGRTRTVARTQARRARRGHRRRRIRHLARARRARALWREAILVGKRGPTGWLARSALGVDHVLDARADDARATARPRARTDRRSRRRRRHRVHREPKRLGGRTGFRLPRRRRLALWRPPGWDERRRSMQLALHYDGIHLTSPFHFTSGAVRIAHDMIVAHEIEVLPLSPTATRSTTLPEAFAALDKVGVSSSPSSRESRANRIPAAENDARRRHVRRRRYPRSRSGRFRSSSRRPARAHGGERRLLRRSCSVVRTAQGAVRLRPRACGNGRRRRRRRAVRGRRARLCTSSRARVSTATILPRTRIRAVRDVALDRPRPGRDGGILPRSMRKRADTLRLPRSMSFLRRLAGRTAGLRRQVVAPRGAAGLPSRAVSARASFRADALAGAPVYVVGWASWG